MSKNILVVDDEEKDILSLVEYNLAKSGYDITCVTTGEDALKITRSATPDLIVLDLMLPGKDGLEVCGILKSGERTKTIPVIILTAKGEESDVVKGLEIGADDYITKPFSPNILIARTKAVLRRASAGFPDEMSVVRIHDIEIHPGQHRTLAGGELVDLTRTEFRIHHYLARRPGWNSRGSRSSTRCMATTIP